MKRQKFLKSLVAVGVVAACVSGLAACTSGGTTSGGVAATVNGTEIAEDDVTAAIQSVRTQSGLDDEDSWGTFLVANEMTPESVREQIIDSLIDQQLVQEGAESLGITVDSTEVDTYVASMKANFDSDEAWQEALEQAGFTEDEYRESIESSLVQQELGTHFEENAEVEESDVLESAQTYAPYYDGSKRSSHILIGVDDVSDEAAMQAAREQAADIRARIVSGDLDFADAAEEYSTDTGSAANGGDVGWDSTSSFVSEYQTALSELELDQVSEPVDSPYGVHIIKVTEVFTAPEEVTSIDQLPEGFRETIETMAASIKANNDYSAWIDELRANADIVINDMPADVPYNIDLTKYQEEADAAAAEGETQDGGTITQVADNSTTGDPDAASEGAESADAASADAADASASSESASAESAEAEGSSSSSAS